MAEKASSFSSFRAGTPMITVNRLKGVITISLGLILLYYGLLEMVLKTI